MSDKMDNGIPVATYWAFGIGAAASIITIPLTESGVKPGMTLSLLCMPGNCTNISSLKTAASYNDFPGISTMLS